MAGLMRVYDKHYNKRLSEYLTLKEVECKCRHPECSRTLISQNNIRSYERLRNRYAKKLRITSGYRCQMHNKEVGGSDYSYHKIGEALDIQPWLDKMELENVGLADALDRLEVYAREEYQVVIRYETFIHCHNLLGEQQ